jgi:hypothetical protein
MQTNQTRAAGAVVAVIAAVGVGYTLRPNSQQAALAARNPAVEVRTVVIRRTIHIVRHERVRPPAQPGGSTPVAAAQPGAQPGTQSPGQPANSAAVRTSTSHHSGTAPASQSTGQPPAGSAPLKTTASKHAAAPTQSPASGTTHGGPVTTRTSTHGSAGTTGTGKPVTTRTSRGHGDDGGGGGGDD